MGESRRVSAPAATPSRGTWFWISLTAIAVLAVTGMAFSDVTFASYGWFGIGLNFYAVLAYAGASALLFGSLRADPRRAIAILAATSGAMAFFRLLTTVTVPLAKSFPAIIPANAHTSSWLFFIQYAIAMFGALEYASSRRTDGGKPLARGTLIAIVAATVLLVALLTAAAFRITGGTTGIAYGLVVLAAITIGALLRLGSRDEIDRALLLSMIAILCMDLIAVHGNARFSIGSIALRLLSASAATFVLLAAARRMIRAYDNLPIMQATLDRTERLALRQSDRLSTVWRLVNEDTLDDEQRIQAILDAGATALRPGIPFFGTLRRVEGEFIVVEVVSEAFPLGSDQRQRFGRNDRIALESVFAADIIAANRTVAFNEYGRTENGERVGKRPNSAQWESLIGTTFLVANTRYVLSYAATVPMTAEPFTDDDLAFVEVLASFLASRLAHGRQAAQIRYQIEHDLLTGLPTRASFRSTATQLIDRRTPCAIVIIDLDRFREVNETFGHMIGDAMLVEIGAGLNAARRNGEVVARLGGDNFGILIDRVETVAEVEARLHPYREVFRQPLVTGDRTGREALFVGASFGVALFPHDATTFADALARADSAVHAAKSRQRGSVSYHNVAFDASVQRRRTLRLELASAIENGQLELYYQPTVELATGAVAGIEALVRWEHPTLGSISPSEFIPIAENSTLIRPVGKWVFRRTLADIERLGALPAAFKCFVNLSGYQLRAPEFITAMRMHLAERPSVFAHVAVDINETVAMQDPDRTLDVMAVLRELGMEIALDDFGTGYSSLSYVTRFPVNVIKIDGRFIERLPGSDHDSALVEVLLGTAQRFSMLTHAEGIETEAQYNWLRERGCTFGQGYFIAPPMNFARLADYLKNSRLMKRAAEPAFRPPS